MVGRWREVERRARARVEMARAQARQVRSRPCCWCRSYLGMGWYSDSSINFKYNN